MYEIEISSLATEEIIDALDWYESVQQGPGDNFLQNLKKFLIPSYKILNHTLTFKNQLDVLLKKFPYSVIYEIVGKKVFVYSVFMAKQNPTKKRLK